MAFLGFSADTCIQWLGLSTKSKWLAFKVQPNSKNYTVIFYTKTYLKQSAFIYFFIYLFIYLFIHLFICLFVYLFIFTDSLDGGDTTGTADSKWDTVRIVLIFFFCERDQSI